MADVWIEVPSAELARALMSQLLALPAQLVDVGGVYRVGISLTGDAEHALAQTLSTIDRWLLDHGLEETRVEIDGRAYTLTAPPRTAHPSARRADPSSPTSRRRAPLREEATGEEPPTARQRVAPPPPA